MRGVGLVTFGGPEVLQVLDLPEGHPGPGEVRLRVHADTVNPTDLGLRDGSRAELLRALILALVALGLAVIFVYAFFKFGWAYRLYNYVAIMVGATPPASQKDTPEAKMHALRVGRL